MLQGQTKHHAKQVGAVSGDRTGVIIFRIEINRRSFIDLTLCRRMSLMINTSGTDILVRGFNYSGCCLSQHLILKKDSLAFFSSSHLDTSSCNFITSNQLRLYLSH